MALTCEHGADGPERAAPDRALALERPARVAVRAEALLDNGDRISPPH
ncbi:hypothetical protein ACH4E7_26640 [Kitasatospora sp. NPDC018058]